MRIAAVVVSARARSRFPAALAALALLVSSAAVASSKPVAAYDLELEDINPRSATHGQRLTLSDLYAERGLLLQFMASWCKPCREELPSVQQLFADDGLPIALIAADEGGGPESLLIVAERTRLTAPILFVPEARVAEVERHYTYGIVPATYAISRSGEILSFHEGAMSKRRLRRLVNSIHD